MGCGSSKTNPGGDIEAATPRPNPNKTRNGLLPNGDTKKANIDTNANISKPGKISFHQNIYQLQKCNSSVD